MCFLVVIINFEKYMKDTLRRRKQNKIKQANKQNKTTTTKNKTKTKTKNTNMQKTRIYDLSSYLMIPA